MPLLDRFADHLASLQLSGEKALVAVSGGPDSVALLDLLMSTSHVHGLALIVAHVDHGIHPASGAVARQVAELAARYGLPCETGTLHLGAATAETVARVERHAWLEAARIRLGADLIFLAHHADDQIETVLMRVLRGSGPAGLAGMAAWRGPLVRPLLPFRRAALAAYVRRKGIPTWADPSNADVGHLRSWLRVALLPAIRDRVLDVDASLLRLAEQAADDRAAWDAVLDREPTLAVRAETDGISLSRPALAAMPSALAASLLKAAARRVGCQLGPMRMDRVEHLMRSGESGASVPLGSGWRAALSFDRLHLVRKPGGPKAGDDAWLVSADRGERAWGSWRFDWRQETSPATHDRQAFTAWFAPVPLTIRAWRPGDAIRPLGGRGARPVTRCFQEAHVPRWRRATWPVVVRPTDAQPDDGTVLWVPGVCRSEAAMPSGSAAALRLDVEPA